MLLKFIFNRARPQRLGDFLLEQCISKQAITDSKHHGGLILVNQKRRHTSFLLNQDDVVHFLTGKEPVNPFLKISDLPLQIIHETNQYLLINKPAGVLSMPSKYEPNDSIVNRVLGYFVRTKQYDSQPHLVSRLDKDTSGLLLIAKNSLIHAHFAAMKKDELVKEYQAIAHGAFNKIARRGIIDKPIAQVGNTVRRQIAPSGKGQTALTKYQVLAERGDMTLIQLQLLTGRTHQIRVHLASINHPIYGDSLYGIADTFHRQALHCYSLTFTEPFTQNRKKFEINLPTDMIGLWGETEVYDE